MTTTINQSINSCGRPNFHNYCLLDETIKLGMHCDRLPAYRFPERTSIKDHRPVWARHPYLLSIYLFALTFCTPAYPGMSSALCATLPWQRIPERVRVSYTKPQAKQQSYFLWHQSALNAMHKQLFPAVHAIEVTACMQQDINQDNIYYDCGPDGKSVSRSYTMYEQKAVACERSYKGHIASIGEWSVLRNKRQPKSWYRGTFIHRHCDDTYDLDVSETSKPKAGIGDMRLDLPVFHGKALHASALDDWKKYLGKRLISKGKDMVAIPLTGRDLVYTKVSAETFTLWSKQREGKKDQWYSQELWLYRLPLNSVIQKTNEHGGIYEELLDTPHYGFHLGDRRKEISFPA